MNVCYRVEWTEYESGVGERPDGVSYALRKFFLEQEIKRIQNLGDYLCYSRAGQIGMCIITDELSGIIFNSPRGVYTTVQGDHPGVLGMFNPDDPKANIELFRKLRPSASAS